MKPADTMCVVEVGLLDLLMPADKGLQLIKLLQSCAAEGHYSFSDNHRQVWTPKPLSKLTLTVLQPDQIDMAKAISRPARAQRGPLLLPGD